MTVSERCCLHCDGTVYKADSEIETIVKNDECGTIETAVCKLNVDEKKAEVEYEYFYKKCCNDDNKGLLFKKLQSLIQ